MKQIKKFLLSKFWETLSPVQQKISILVVTSLLISMLMLDFRSNLTVATNLKKGEVSQNTVIAPTDLTFDPKGLPSITVKRGQVIVRVGDLITPEQEAILREIQKEISSVSVVKQHLVSFIFTSFILFLSYLFCNSLLPNFRPKNKDLIALAIVVSLQFLVIKASTIFATALSYSFSLLEQNDFLLLTPIATAGVISSVILGPAALCFVMLSGSLLLGFYHNNFWLEVSLLVCGSIVPSLGVKRFSRRSSYIYAGIKIASCNVFLVACYIIIAPITFHQSSHLILFTIFSGLASGILAGSLSPFAEYFGGYITEIKLLELASLDRPLLRELSLQAPGTWNHSIVMAQISEVAAEAIGANPLLVRVAAYYHDIGKTRKPGYFVENQTGKENRHDKLTPSMSALIIKAHVKDGIEMAEQAGLPPILIDFIPQHHGTSLVEFFYNKALAEAAEGEEVNEQHYRYPGPKPQTKEAGIVMLADSVEAASRTINEPTHAKIQGLVQKIINKIFTSGELDECDLTLKDLHLIAKCFTRVLTGIYHKRIEYSETAEKVKELKPIKARTDETKEEDHKSEKIRAKESNRTSLEQEVVKEVTENIPSTENAPPENKEALKRLGMR